MFVGELRGLNLFGGQPFFFGSEDVVAGSAMRLMACAGLVTAGLLMGGAGAGIGVADRGDSAGPRADAGSVTSKAGSGSGGSGGATGATDPGPPASKLGNGRQDIDVKSINEQKKKNDNPIGPQKFNGSLTIPVLRVPKRDELPASGLPDLSLFYTTVVIPVPTLSGVFAALQPKPEPTPAPAPALRTQPAPALRTQVEAPAPVVDSGGGGVDPASTGIAAEPPVLQAPMVVAPIPIPLPPVVAPVAPLGMSAGAGPKQAVALVDSAAAGARAPLIRGSLPPAAVEPQAKALTPMSGQATRLGYPRYLRNPTATELAAIAMPGATGLLFLTFGGGFIGYRQANSVRFIRTHGAERFLR
jgi:hypothetical protein